MDYQKDYMYYVPLDWNVFKLVQYRTFWNVLSLYNIERFVLKQVEDNDTSSENSLPVDSVARDLATMHTICATHQTELKKQAETKVSY